MKALLQIHPFLKPVQAKPKAGKASLWCRSFKCFKETKTQT